MFGRFSYDTARKPNVLADYINTHEQKSRKCEQSGLTAIEPVAEEAGRRSSAGGVFMRFPERTHHCVRNAMQT